MLIKTKEFQDACKKILAAIDTDATSKALPFGYDTVEVRGHGDGMDLIASNGTYCVKVSLGCEDAGGEWHAAVDGKLFLGLMAKFTADSVELSIDGNSLAAKGNGKYRFPLKYGDDGEPVSIPGIGLGEKTASFPIDGSILLSIAEENSKELAKKKATRPIQQLYYVDGKGCITWTNSSACVNSFALPKDVRLLLPQKVAKLFKLFSPGEVSFEMGHAAAGSIMQTRVSFSQGNVSMSAVLQGDDGLFASIPLDALRGRAEKDYESKATFDAAELAGALDRLGLFSSDAFSSPTATVSFSGTEAVIKEPLRGNDESVRIEGGQGFEGKSFSFVIDSVKSLLQGCKSKDVTMSFDDGPAFVVSLGTIRNVVGKARAN